MPRRSIQIPARALTLGRPLYLCRRLKPSRYQQTLASPRNNVGRKLNLVAQQGLLAKDMLRPATTRKEKPNILHTNLLYGRKPFWQAVGRWKNVLDEHFLSYEWQVSQDFSITLSAPDSQVADEKYY